MPIFESNEVTSHSLAKQLSLNRLSTGAAQSYAAQSQILSHREKQKTNKSTKPFIPMNEKVIASIDIQQTKQ